MEFKFMKSQIKEFSNLLFKLLNSKPIKIEDILESKPNNFNVSGVYLINLPDDSKTVYAGKTRTKTVFGRIKDHCSINTNSDLKGMLIRNPDYPSSKIDYLVRCVEINDDRERTFFEHFAIGVLKPDFNK